MLYNFFCQACVLKLCFELLGILIDTDADVAETFLSLGEEVRHALDFIPELRSKNSCRSAGLLIWIENITLLIQCLIRIRGRVIMRYLAKLDHAEIDEFELIVLGDDYIKRTDVVVDQFLVLSELLDHIYCL